MPYCPTNKELELVSKGKLTDTDVVKAIARELIGARKKLAEMKRDSNPDNKSYSWVGTKD